MKPVLPECPLSGPFVVNSAVNAADYTGTTDVCGRHGNGVQTGKVDVLDQRIFDP